MAGSNIYIAGKWKTQTFTSNGTFTVPGTVTQVFVEMYGGGGGGASYTNSGASSYAVYGGESGERVHANIAVTPGASIPVVIGSGGVGGAVGLNGTATSFGSFKSRGGLGGGKLINEGVGGIEGSVFAKGIGRGQDSFRAAGGATILVSSNPLFSIFGGDAGHANGGAAASGSDASDGGRGAGGGASVNGTGGDGGDGICIVSWKVE